MTTQEFDEQIKRLADTFGPTHYSKERIKQAWIEFSGASAEVLRWAVTELIAEKRQAPLLPEMREAVSRARESEWQKNRRRITIGGSGQLGDACTQCKGNGAILARHKNDGSPFAFKCNCSIGRDDSRLFPMWSDSLKEEYSLI